MSVTTQTRRESYDNVMPSVANRQEVIHNFLSSYEDGLTANELARYMYLADLVPLDTRNSVHPRLNEMVADTRVKVDGKRRCTITGKTCGIYKVMTDEDYQRLKDIDDQVWDLFDFPTDSTD